MKHIRTINPLKDKSVRNTGCGECAASCQSACKTSCTVGNQVCINQETRGKKQEVRGMR